MNQQVRYASRERPLSVDAQQLAASQMLATQNQLSAEEEFKRDMEMLQQSPAKGNLSRVCSSPQLLSKVRVEDLGSPAEDTPPSREPTNNKIPGPFNKFSLLDDALCDVESEESANNDLQTKIAKMT